MYRTRIVSKFIFSTRRVIQLLSALVILGFSQAALATVATVLAVDSATADATYKIGDVIDITVQFSEAVTVDTTGGTPALALNSGGTATYLSGTTTDTLTFRYTVLSGESASDLDYSATTSLTNGGGTILDTATGMDAADLTLAAPGGFAAAHAIVVDGIAPTVSSVNRQTPATASTNATSVVYRVTFNENVSGVDVTDFTVTATGTAAGNVASVSAATGTTIDVTVDTISGDGTLRLDVNAAATGIVDDAGNGLNGGFTTGQTYTIDNTAPSVLTSTRLTPATVSTNATSVVFRVVFNESVTGVDVTDFGKTMTGTVTGNIASVSAASGTTIDVTVDTISGDGTFELDVNGPGITDVAGNALSSGFGGQSYTIDNTAPTVSSINRQTPAGATTNATSVVYRVTFSESVSGVDVTDFAITATGTASGNVASVSAASGTTIDVTVDTITGDGTLRLDLNAAATGITDSATNAISGGFTSGQTYTIDSTAPSVSSINRQTPATATTNATSVVYRVTFSESVSGVDTTDFAITATGTASGNVASVSAASGTTIDVTVDTITGEGTLRLDLNAAATGITDSATNAISGGYTSGQTYTIDTTVPTVISINRLTPATAATNATTLVWRVTFSEAVSGVDTTDFNLFAAGMSTAAGSIQSVSASSGTTIDVTVNSVTGDGSLQLGLNNAISGTLIVDAAGNACDGYSSGQAYTIDNTAPSVSSINRQTPGTASTNATSVVYRVTFSESVTGVDTTDFTLTTTSGTAAGNVASVSAASGTTIDVTVDTITGEGVLRLDLNAAATGITDSSVGTAISGGFTTGQTYTIDATVPSVSSINRQTPAGAVTNATSVVYRVTFSESVSGVDTTDFAVTATGTASGNVASVSAASGTTIDVTVDTITGDGTLRLDLNAAATGITDSASNAISGGFTSGQTYTIDSTAPSVSSINRQTPATASTNATSVVYRVTFSESVSGVDTTDFAITATGTASGNVASVSAASGTTIDVTVDTITGDGTLRLDLNAAATGITDSATNAISGGFTSGQTYTIDNTAPSVTSINRAGVSPTTASSIDYTVTFSETVTGVGASDFTLTATGTASGTIASVTPVSGSVYTVTVNHQFGTGTLQLDLNSSGTGIADSVGNAITTGHSGDQTYSVSPAVDVNVAFTRDMSSANEGGIIIYTFTVLNNGSAGTSTLNPATMTAQFTPPGTLTSVTWTCTDGLGTTGACPSASGSGAISETVTLAPTESVIYMVSGTVGETEGNTLSVTAAITPVEHDISAADNTETYALPVGVFINGFEDN